MVLLVTFIMILFVFIGAFIVMYWELAKGRAMALLLIFTAQSLMIKNLPVEKRPDYIVFKALENRGAIKRTTRRASVWVINHRGAKIVEPMLEYMVTDLRVDKKAQEIV